MRCGAAMLAEAPRGHGAGAGGGGRRGSRQLGAAGGVVGAGRRRLGEQEGPWEAGGRWWGSHSYCAPACASMRRSVGFRSGGGYSGEQEEEEQQRPLAPAITAAVKVCASCSQPCHLAGGPTAGQACDRAVAGGGMERREVWGAWRCGVCAADGSRVCGSYRPGTTGQLGQSLRSGTGRYGMLCGNRHVAIRRKPDRGTGHTA